MATHRRILTACATLVTLLTAAAGAQARASVNGVVYDSLVSAPLSGALVAIVGTSRSTISDDKGRFHFDSLAPNTYTFTAQHDAIDSAGFSGLSVKANVAGPNTSVSIALPSFSTLYKTVCPGRVESRDSGFVFGSISDAKGTVVTSAFIDISWIDLTVDKAKGVKQRRTHAETKADARGFGLCGVPRDLEIEVKATADVGGASGDITLPPRAIGIRRLDLVVGAQGADAPRGVVIGRVLSTTGAPIRIARVIIDTLPEVRTDTAGRFTIRGVPVGTQQLSVTAIGMAPTSQAVQVHPNDTTYVDVKASAAVQLAPVTVSAERQVRLAREIAERQKLGFGTIRDSSQIVLGTIAATFRSFPSTQVVNLNRSSAGDYWQIRFRDGAGTCPAIIWINGVKVPGDMLNTLQPEDIAVAEIYPSKQLVPNEFTSIGNPCGVVAIWTKNHLR